MDSYLLSSPSDRSYRNSRMMNHGGMGILYPHPPTTTFSSLPLPYSKQPPLLPLPNSKTYSSLPILPYPPPRNNNRGRPRTTTNLSTSPPTNKKNTKSSSPKKQDSNIKGSDKLGAKSSENAKVLKSSIPPSVEVEEGGFEEMGGSIFSLAPPPSSLPLPKFSLKPKVSCNVEAVATASGGGIDAGATDDLRKLLHLC